MTDAAAGGGPVPRWKQKEAIRARGGRRRSGHDASAWRPERDGQDGCVTGHPALFTLTPTYELERMPEGGGYPVGFIDAAAKLMGCQDLGEVVHLCSGSIRSTFTFDLRDDSAAAVRADVRELPIRSSSVRWVMADPPYDQEYAEVLWGMGKQYPIPAVLLREIGRILRPGGRAAFLHHLVPTLPAGMARIGTYGVTTGTGYRIRALTIAERLADVGELAMASAPKGPLMDDFTCRLCWATFDGPGELAQHEQDETDRLYPIDGQPSMKAETI